MVEYECHRCHKVFNRKSSYEYHVKKRKTPCVKTINDKPDRKTSPECVLCGKSYYDKWSLHRHMKHKHNNRWDSKNKVIIKTTVETPVDDDVDDITSHKVNKYFCPLCNRSFTRHKNLKEHLSHMRCNELKESINQIKDELIEEKATDDKTTTNNVVSGVDNSQVYLNNKDSFNNNNNVNNIQQNLLLMNYGKEDLYSYPRHVYLDMMKKGYNSIPSFVKYVHLNPTNPKSHNIFFSDRKDKYLQIKRNDVKETIEKKTVISELYHDNYDALVENYEEIKDDLTEDEMKKLNNFVKFVDEAEGNPESIKAAICERIGLDLYDNKHVVKATWKKLGLMGK